MSSDYHFTGTWTLPSPPQQAREVVVDLARYPEWWPQVVAVASLGIDVARVLCRSRLPYTLDLVLHAASRELPDLEVRVGGDLDGYVRWRLTPGAQPRTTLMELDQRVRVTGPLTLVSPLLRPALAWNHRQMMDSGVAGLVDRLTRA